jgi:hypothetical protein
VYNRYERDCRHPNCIHQRFHFKLHSKSVFVQAPQVHELLTASHNNYTVTHLYLNRPAQLQEIQGY